MNRQNVLVFAKDQLPRVPIQLARRHAPLAAIDALVVVLSLSLAWGARDITGRADLYSALLFLPVAVGVSLTVNLAFRLYHRIWKYASVGEAVAIFAATETSTAILGLIDLLWPGVRPVPIGVVLMMSGFAFMGFVAARYRRRMWTALVWRWRVLWGQQPVEQTRVLIVGAGDAGQLLAWRFINQKSGAQYRLVGFVDDNPRMHGMRLHGVRILGDRNQIPRLVDELGVDLIVIAIYNICSADFQGVLDICVQTDAVIKVLPNIFNLFESRNGVAPLRDVSVEDLLGRRPTEIDMTACRDLLGDKVVLVTGAAGSIGSELCRQIVTFGPRRLVMLDNNESGLYDLNIELSRPRKGRGESDRTASELTPVIADVTREARIRAVFRTYRPEIVFHAAAYKHVPLMEEYPEESLRTNVLGTHNVSRLAADHGAERFVLVSTDKAINPSSIMGASKRLCEMLIGAGVPALKESPWERALLREGEGEMCPAAGTNGHDLSAPLRLFPVSLGCPGASAPQGRTLFTAVRFGNVLNSRGSVVPTFERQIDQGGPVTVTDPEMTRYFMSIPEAASLIIQAAVLTEGGDVFMLNMGRRILIDDLARRLIRLRGLRPDVDVPVVYTGVRPGEKMHEELLADREERMPTSHRNIFRIRRMAGTRGLVSWHQLHDLVALLEAERHEEMVARLWELAGMRTEPVLSEEFAAVN